MCSKSTDSECLQNCGSSLLRSNSKRNFSWTSVGGKRPFDTNIIIIAYKVRKLTVGYIVKENKSLVHGFVKLSKNGHNSGRRLAKSAVLHGERECGKLGKQEVSCDQSREVEELKVR